ncbi:hypothetical protein BGX28_001259 [Mortierella sp. GBA30]|nr:hypothetical protein BGX28_001259 [Mortierella sp. GBA30]
MIWGLPSTIDGEFVLLLVWDIPWKPAEFGDDYWEGESGPWHVYDEADDICRKAILRYVGSHMSSYPSPENPMDNVISWICFWWRPEAGTMYENFVEALLDGTNGAWLPMQDRRLQRNPLWILYCAVHKAPRAMVLAETIINYCIRQARLDRDPRYLQPVIQTMWSLFDPNQHQLDIGLKTLHRLAFFRPNNRQFIVDHHIIAYPPDLRLKIWEAKSLPLYKCKDPIVQLDLSKSENLLNDNFTRELFEAWFELICLVHWIFVLLCIMWQKCKPLSKLIVKCHELPLESLDNPAVAALIQYKWNMFGYKYWLIRFLSQLCYYILILFVVTRQINNDHFEELQGVCIAIIVCSAIFLWLEMIQFLRDKKRYMSSLYNFVDIIVFGLPLAASINQLLMAAGKITEDHNIGLFSFSVLFIFLHILFELRVIKSVCYFVTIIIRAIKKIKVFFFVFFFGIIAFTVGNLHLLRGCSFKDCSTSESYFPSNFYSALSTTYFFMGGRYDQIGDEMNDNGGYWEFQTMMIVFFFFTVILMLNVLIALINQAFGDGDTTWRQVWLENRLRIVEVAEDMSFRIQGFRESHNWFPESIYYSATPQQIRAYQNKYFDGQEEFISNTPSGTTKDEDERRKPFDILAPSIPQKFFGWSEGIENPQKATPVRKTKLGTKEDISVPNSSDTIAGESNASITSLLGSAIQEGEQESEVANGITTYHHPTETSDDPLPLLQSFENLQKDLAQSRDQISALHKELQEQRRLTETRNRRLEEQLKEQGREMQENFATMLSAIVASTQNMRAESSSSTRNTGQSYTYLQKEPCSTK